MKNMSGTTKFLIIALAVTVGPICLFLIFMFIRILFPTLPNPYPADDPEQTARQRLSMLCRDYRDGELEPFSGQQVISGTVYSPGTDGSLDGVYPNWKNSDTARGSTAIICESRTTEVFDKDCGKYSDGFTEVGPIAARRRQVSFALVDVNTGTVIVEKQVLGDSVTCPRTITIPNYDQGNFLGTEPTAEQKQAAVKALFQ